MKDVTRRGVLGTIGTGLVLSTSASTAQTPGSGVAPQMAGRLLNVVQLGADPSGGSDSSAAFQQAIDEVAPTGGTIYVPAGRYVIGRTLTWQNPRNARAPGILFQGDGPHSTVLVAQARSGPLLRVRGVPSRGPISTTFFWGGGIKNLTIEGGGGGGAGQHGLDVLGWYYGEIDNCHFVRLGGHGIQCSVDLGIDANPDYTSSTLFVRGTWFERLGGWGFLDASNYQGAPAWSWDRCIFVFCRQGGAHVRSGGHSFTKCSFSGCGWQSEGSATGSPGYGLYFDGAATPCSQHLVEGCEFDTNLRAHVGARFLMASTFMNNRFIASDRHRRGRLDPTIGVELGSGDANATLRGVSFQQNFFRFDVPGEAVAYDFANSANVRDIEIANSVFTQAPGRSVITRYRGDNPGNQGNAFGFVIRDRREP